MIDLFIILSATIAVVIAAFVTRTLVGVDDAVLPATASEDEDGGWFPVGLDFLLLEDARRKLARDNKSTGLSF